MRLTMLCAHLFTLGLALADVVGAQQDKTILATNNDVTGPEKTNTGSVFRIAAIGDFNMPNQARTGGHGGGGGDFAPKRILHVMVGQDRCVFASDAQTGDIVSFNGDQFTLVGNFFARPSDSGVTGTLKMGTAYGVGLAANSHYLYASYAASGNISTFEIDTGCKLSFVDDTFAVGLNNGWVTGMAVRDCLLVVAYGDGSIESFDISAGEPIS